MKKMRMTAVLLLAVLLAGCADSSGGADSSTSAEKVETAASAENAGAEDGMDSAAEDVNGEDGMSAADSEDSLTESTENMEAADGMDSAENEDSSDSEIAEGEVDLDLTQMSSTVVYSEVYNIMTDPETYMGKTIKMDGQFAVYTDEETGKHYFACIITDATACCQQGIEFIWEGNHMYPQDYPEMGTIITVTGVFDKYEEYGNIYYYMDANYVKF